MAKQQYGYNKHRPSQEELILIHVDDEGEEEEGEVRKEGGILGEGAPCWPKLYTTGIVPEVKCASVLIPG